MTPHNRFRALPGRAWFRTSLGTLAWLGGSALGGFAQEDAPPSDGEPDYNRLIHELSPYLRQHAANPVDWYPWGKEAFAAARQQDKPVFLSIGYATCHWCHVMKRESFEDEAVAAFLNEHFISIKVDREERPDVDHVYMQVTRRLAGQSGWPVTVFMTPDEQPFFAGTYFPPEGKRGRPGFLDLLQHTVRLWQERRDQLQETAAQISQQLQESIAIEPGEGISEETLHTAFQSLRSSYDPEHGGFGRAPKFPNPDKVRFLLRYGTRFGDEAAIAMAEDTLQRLRHGGIYDHIGGGFHRYAVDRAWGVPHFEKMLYDQALVAMAYTDAYLATGRSEYATTVHEIMTYVLRDMTGPEGGFISAEDAESEGEEGRFYLWQTDELTTALGEEDGKWLSDQFSFQTEGNFVDPATGRLSGRNILRLRPFPTPTASGQLVTEAARNDRLRLLKEKLRVVRDQRPRPLTDDKILTDWNGLMMAALAQAGMALDEPRYVAAAERNADFLLTHLRQENGRLWKRYRSGEAGLPAHLDDYAFLVWGLLDLYEATFTVSYLEAALELTDDMLQLFANDAVGGFFLTAKDGEALLFRSKEFADGAIPAGNSVAALNLIRLHRMTGNAIYEESLDRLLKAVSGTFAGGTTNYSQLMCAVDFALGPSAEIVLAGQPNSPDLQPMLGAVRGTFYPNKVVLFRPDAEGLPPIATLAPFTQHQTSLDGQATVYFCRNFTCLMPSTDPAFLHAQLSRTDVNSSEN